MAYPSLQSHFLLDPSITFLNHGSFGACPQEIFTEYQRWQQELERQPVYFLGRRWNDLLLQARQALGAYLHAPATELVFLPNATFGVNIIARSLELRPGDEILSTDHEYGACDKTWQFICQQSGATYRRMPVSLPIRSAEEVIEQIWRGVNDRTRLLFLSHITSPTALRLPVEELIRRAAARGILTLVDGAHAPGQVPLDLTALGAAFYTGNCHKWMLAPKGAGFLYVRSEYHTMLKPLVVSWGYQPEPEKQLDSPLVDLFQWMGTRDPAACLTVPAAIRFMEDHNWQQVQAHCHAMLREALAQLEALTGYPPLTPPAQEGWYCQMAAAELPPLQNPAAFQQALYEQFHIEVPITRWNGRDLLRISVQAYNSERHLQNLLHAVGALLPQHRAGGLG